MTETDIFLYRSEERDSSSDQDRDASDDEALNQSGAEEALNGDSAIDVEMFRAARFEFRNNVSGIAGHLLKVGSNDS
jgi:hypothetical protein